MHVKNSLQIKGDLEIIVYRGTKRPEHQLTDKNKDAFEWGRSARIVIDTLEILRLKVSRYVFRDRSNDRRPTIKIVTQRRLQWPLELPMNLNFNDKSQLLYCTFVWPLELNKRRRGLMNETHLIFSFWTKNNNKFSAYCWRNLVKVQVALLFNISFIALKHPAAFSWN